VPVVLAGGLTSENVAEAARVEGVVGVDVSSGVEVEPGKKDLRKMNLFISNAKTSCKS
jgi:phosphoribosylanthranilate isomerase